MSTYIECDAFDETRPCKLSNGNGVRNPFNVEFASALVGIKESLKDPSFHIGMTNLSKDRLQLDLSIKPITTNYPMQNTRQRILDFLATQPKATATELSQRFEMTSANLRHHLSVLVKEGMIEVIGQSPPDGRGRPTLLYMRTPQNQPHGLDLLTSALLQNVVKARTARQRSARLKSLAETLIAGAQSASRSITIRLGAAVQRLNELRYRARWEAHVDGPRVILGQCPYAAIIADHPELCQLDAYILESMLDTEVEHTVKLERTPEGAPHCVFAVG